MTTVLLREDFSTRTWKRLSQHLDARLTDLRQQNDRELDEIQTASIRGSIGEVKRILALAEQASAGPSITPGELAGDDPSGKWQDA